MNSKTSSPSGQPTWTVIMPETLSDTAARWTPGTGWIDPRLDPQAVLDLMEHAE